MPELSKKLLDQFVTRPMNAGAVEAVLRKFKSAATERALGANITHDMGYPPGAAKPGDTSNHRNGKRAKTVLTEGGALCVEIPRDRSGTFEPQRISKHERCFTGFHNKMIVMYARGMTLREIQAFLHEMYNIEPDPQQPGLCELEKEEADDGALKADLYGAQRRSGQSRVGRLRARTVGSEIPDHSGQLAPRLVACDPGLCVLVGGAASCTSQTPLKVCMRGCTRSSSRTPIFTATMPRPS